MYMYLYIYHTCTLHCWQIVFFMFQNVTCCIYTHVVHVCRTYMLYTLVVYTCCTYMLYHMVYSHVVHTCCTHMLYIHVVFTSCCTHIEFSMEIPRYVIVGSFINFNPKLPPGRANASLVKSSYIKL